MRKQPVAASPLMVRVSVADKQVLSKAAELRRISVSDYVRTVTLPQAQREVKSAKEQVISLTPDEQLEFWMALNLRMPLTPAQKQLGAIVRGKA